MFVLKWVDLFKSHLTHHSSNIHNFSHIWRTELKLHPQLDTTCIEYIWKYYIVVGVTILKTLRICYAILFPETLGIYLHIYCCRVFTYLWHSWPKKSVNRWFIDRWEVSCTVIVILLLMGYHFNTDLITYFSLRFYFEDDPSNRCSAITWKHSQLKSSTGNLNVVNSGSRIKWQNIDILTNLQIWYSWCIKIWLYVWINPSHLH